MNIPPRISISNDLLLPQICDFLREGHTVTIPVRGNSMNPFMVDRRDKVTIAPLTLQKVRKGDLLLAYESKQKRYVLHRLICIEATTYILMGDGNIKGTETIFPEDLIGIVTDIVRKGKNYSTSSFIWKFYSVIWTALCPIRRWILAIWRRI